MNKPWLITIVGPTAVGKTSLAIDFAEKLGTEIISCDSRQIYRELIVGAARPTDEQLNHISHHFIAIRSVKDYYNASMFETESLQLLKQLFEKHQAVIMTGGSGLYVDAVINGIDDFPTTDPEVRQQLLKLFEKEGIEGLRNQLKRVDPVYYSQVDLRNSKRILKALEVNIMTGRPYSSFLLKTRKERPFNILKIALNLDRKELHQRINLRVDEMVKKGLVEEAKSLFALKNLNALNTVGYKEMFDHLDGKQTLEVAIELIKRNTRRYARRQISYFSRDKEYHWFHPDEKEKILNYILENIVI